MAFEPVIHADGTVQRPRLIPPPRDAHKYSRGGALVISGPPLRTGASRLAAEAALAVGAGIVIIMGEVEALREHAAHATAIMLRGYDPDGIDHRITALAIGPGAGTGDFTRLAITELLRLQRPIVIDADGLTSFAASPLDLFAMLNPAAVLTPHEGEFAKLFPDLSLNDRTGAAQQAAASAGGTVLLKGPDTVIAAPDGRVAINTHSTPWLATAGSGDILTGLICGVMAQGTPPFEAACIAAWLHGDIGIRGGAGLTADTMLHHLPAVLADCLVL